MIHPLLTFPQDQIHTHGQGEKCHEAEHDAEIVPDRRGRVVPIDHVFFGGPSGPSGFEVESSSPTNPSQLSSTGYHQ